MDPRRGPPLAGDNGRESDSELRWQCWSSPAPQRVYLSSWGDASCPARALRPHDLLRRREHGLAHPSHQRARPVVWLDHPQAVRAPRYRFRHTRRRPAVVTYNPGLGREGDESKIRTSEGECRRVTRERRVAGQLRPRTRVRWYNTGPRDRTCPRESAFNEQKNTSNIKGLIEPSTIRHAHASDGSV